MGAYPDFSAQGFQVIQELGRNPGGGRVTYLAQVLPGNVLGLDPGQIDRVVIKQFQFAQGSGWEGYKAIERETQALKDLQHSGIPRYLGGFETGDCYCLVQEYKEAQPLSVPRSFSPEQIKQVALSLLEILVYLQERMPPVIHRDIKPENVLVSDDLQVFLIDFGFARIGGNDLAMSSVAAGTFGFMPPEQIRNQTLTTASDLYGLGLTLVCLIGQVKSHKIGDYMDYDGQLDQRAIDTHLTGCSFRFIDWLKQMVAPNPTKRFPDAATAMEALKPLYVKRTPEVQLSCTELNFVATQIGEKLTQTITITNPVSETILEGDWEVAPHLNDPPHKPKSHPWIFITPRTIHGNKTVCSVTLYTRQLQLGKSGFRNLIFRSNAYTEEIILVIKIKTANPSVRLSKFFIIFDNLYPCMTIILGMLTVSAFSDAFQSSQNIFIPAITSMITGCLVVIISSFIGMFIILFPLFMIWPILGEDDQLRNQSTEITETFVLVATSIFLASISVWIGIGSILTTMFFISSFYEEGSSKFFSIQLQNVWKRLWVRFGLSFAFGSSIGLVNAIDFATHILILIIVGSGCALISTSISPILTHHRQLTTKKSKVHRLIEP
jgi:serine/threonine protein kinase